MILRKITKVLFVARCRCQLFLRFLLLGIKERFFLQEHAFLHLENNIHPSVNRSSNYPYQQAVLPRYELVFQNYDQYQHNSHQLPAIYSGIGLGVYQGEIVVFRQMAIGEKHWVVSKLRFEDVCQFPDSLLSEVHLASCFLRLYYTQSDLVKTGLQTKDAIELMKSHCQLADNLGMLLKGLTHDGKHTTDTKPNQEKAQNQQFLICQQCPYVRKSNINEDI